MQIHWVWEGQVVCSQMLQSYDKNLGWYWEIHNGYCHSRICGWIQFGLGERTASSLARKRTENMREYKRCWRHNSQSRKSHSSKSRIRRTQTKRFSESHWNWQLNWTLERRLSTKKFQELRRTVDKLSGKTVMQLLLLKALMTKTPYC